MTDVTAVIDRYFSLWTEPDAARRQDLIAQTFTEDVRYITPQFAVQGHEGIANMAKELGGHLAGYRYLRASTIDAHNDRVRVGWEVIPPEGSVRFAAGVNFCEIAPDGRLSAITGFTDFLAHGEGAHAGE
ncbi:MAG: nuclear transport factor 2 family protein [Thermomicrobiales bacterium]